MEPWNAADLHRRFRNPSRRRDERGAPRSGTRHRPEGDHGGLGGRSQQRGHRASRRELENGRNKTETEGEPALQPGRSTVASRPMPRGAASSSESFSTFGRQDHAALTSKAGTTFAARPRASSRPSGRAPRGGCRTDAGGGHTGSERGRRRPMIRTSDIPAVMERQALIERAQHRAVAEAEATIGDARADGEAHGMGILRWTVRRGLRSGRAPADVEGMGRRAARRPRRPVDRTCTAIMADRIDEALRRIGRRPGIDQAFSCP